MSKLLSTDLLAYYRGVSQQPLTIVDVETTGMVASESRVIEISVLQASLADGIQHQRTDLIDPGIPVPPKITQITGIKTAMLKAATGADQIWPHYLPLLTTGILTSHNLAFDYPFLQNEFQRLDTVFSRPERERLCTVLLSRQLLPDLRSRSLPELVRHFGFKVGASHRAEADAQACWLLAKRLLTDIQNEPDEKLLALFARQWLDLKDAAAILGCSQKQARSQLEQANVLTRKTSSRYRRGGSVLYQRGGIEQVFLAQQDDTQLSFF